MEIELETLLCTCVGVWTQLKQHSHSWGKIVCDSPLHFSFSVGQIQSGSRDLAPCPWSSQFSQVKSFYPFLKDWAGPADPDPEPAGVPWVSWSWIRVPHTCSIRALTHVPVAPSSHVFRPTILPSWVNPNAFCSQLQWTLNMKILLKKTMRPRSLEPTLLSLRLGTHSQRCSNQSSAAPSCCGVAPLGLYGGCCCVAPNTLGAFGVTQWGDATARWGSMTQHSVCPVRTLSSSQETQNFPLVSLQPAPTNPSIKSLVLLGLQLCEDFFELVPIALEETFDNVR